MEEEIIKAKFKKTILFRVFLAIGVCFILIALIWGISWTNDKYSNGKELHHFFLSGWDDIYIAALYDSPYAFYKHASQAPEYASEINAFRTLFFVGLFEFICSFFLYWLMCHCALTITNRRVIGKASFGKSVDLPINQVSAIGLGFFSRISIATSSGRLHFWLVENRQEVHSALSELIGKVQGEASSLQSTRGTGSSADELKKYKDLLDSGVITQAEFDAKKKQLLGL